MTAPRRPIACTLSPGDYCDRLAWIAALNAEELLVATRRGSTLDLRYEGGALERVRMLVAQESACCGFLEFRVEQEPDGPVRLVITAPDEVDGSAADLLDAFTRRA